MDILYQQRQLEKRFILFGEWKIKEINMRKNNSEYLTEAKKMYDRLHKIYESEKDNLSTLELGKLLIKTVDPSAKDGGRKTSEKYTQFDGWIPLNNGRVFTFYKGILESSKDGDFNTFIEDLTMGYYCKIYSPEIPIIKTQELILEIKSL